MVLLQLKDPLELFVNGRDFFPSFYISISLRYDLSCGKQLKNPLFPSFLHNERFQCKLKFSPLCYCYDMDQGHFVFSH